MPAVSLADRNPERLSLPDLVRRSTAACVDRSTLVHIRHDRLRPWVTTFDVAAARERAAGDVIGSDTVHRAALLGDIERHMALAIATVAVNFTSGWHDVISKRPGQSGAVSMIGRLVDYEAATGAFTPSRLQAITVADCSQIFEQHLDGDSVEQLLSLLADALNDLGDFGEAHGGFVPAVAEAGGSAVRLAELIGARPTWHDVAEHRGEPVAFFKRAQLLAPTLARTLGNKAPARFNDLDQLTIFADNLVPHVLRLDGLLEVDSQLVGAIDRAELLAAGGEAEVELRAAAVHVAELLLVEIASSSGGRQPPLSAADLDHALWTRGGGQVYKARPRHRCRNRFY